MKLLSTSSLRWRLVTVLALAYIVVAVATEIVAYTTQQRNLHAQLVESAAADAHILSVGAVSFLGSNSANDLQTLRYFVKSMKNAPGGQQVVRASVQNVAGCFVASTDPRQTRHVCEALPGASPSPQTLSNGDVLAQGLVVEQGPIEGLAQVVLSGSSVTDTVNNGLVTDLLLRGIGLILFLFLALAISQYFLGPLTVLSRAATAIQHGQLGTRMPMEGGTELVTVASAFNDMAGALEQRIKHLSFLAAAAAVLPGLFRDKGDISPTFGEFCRQLETAGIGLFSRGDPNQQPIWFDLDRGDNVWHQPARAAAERATQPAAAFREGWSIMSVPVLGNTLFVTARHGERPFTQEEQQVITNFAYQVGTAADNASLFESQQEALQVKDQFLSIVSHELRTPLTTIKGYSQMLTRKMTDDPSSRRFANNIDIQVSRLGRLVDDLLDVTRYSRGQFELKRQYIDLRPVLEDIIARFRLIAPTHGFTLSMEDGTYEGHWDRDRIEQVMNNLIGNAVKYSPPEGTVAVSARHEDGFLRIGVRDQGIGIPEEEQKHLFERFFRGSAEGGNVKGLGLGLYVTQRIVDAHGGAVGVQSKPGHGSEFYFTLPLAEIPAALALHAGNT